MKDLSERHSGCLVFKPVLGTGHLGVPEGDLRLLSKKALCFFYMTRKKYFVITIIIINIIIIRLFICTNKWRHCCFIARSDSLFILFNILIIITLHINLVAFVCLFVCLGRVCVMGWPVVWYIWNRIFKFYQCGNRVLYDDNTKI